jgi:hypothetical protein
MNNNNNNNVVNPSPTLLLPPSSPHHNFPISDTTTQLLPTSFSSNVRPSLQRWLHEAGPISQQQQPPKPAGGASSSSSGLQEDLNILRERELRRLVNLHRQDHQLLVKSELPSFRLVGAGGSGAAAHHHHHQHQEDPGAHEQGKTATFGANSSSMSSTGVVSGMSSQAGVGQTLISNQVMGGSSSAQGGGGGGGLMYGGINTRSSPFGGGPMSSEAQTFGTSRTRQGVAEGMGIMMMSSQAGDEQVQSFRGGSQGDTSLSGGQDSSAAIDEGLLQDMFKPIIPNISRS